jgi:hypothetical protein
MTQFTIHGRDWSLEDAVGPMLVDRADGASIQPKDVISRKVGVLGEHIVTGETIVLDAMTEGLVAKDDPLARRYLRIF